MWILSLFQSQFLQFGCTFAVSSWFLETSLCRVVNLGKKAPRIELSIILCSSGVVTRATEQVLTSLWSRGLVGPEIFPSFLAIRRADVGDLSTHAQDASCSPWVNLTNNEARNNCFCRHLMWSLSFNEKMPSFSAVDWQSLHSWTAGMGSLGEEHVLLERAEDFLTLSDNLRYQSFS